MAKISRWKKIRFALAIIWIDFLKMLKFRIGVPNEIPIFRDCTIKIIDGKKRETT